MITAKVTINLKKGILDPQGKTVHHALESLGFAGVQEVRIGKSIELTFDSDSEQSVREVTETACEKLLANPVIEDYEIEFVKSA